MVLTMELRVGGQYLNRKGETVEIMEIVSGYEASHGWYWSCRIEGTGSTFNWTREGLYWPVGHEFYDPDDLNHISFDGYHRISTRAHGPMRPNLPIREWF
jgi:hypothetical protein